VQGAVLCNESIALLSDKAAIAFRLLLIAFSDRRVMPQPVPSYWTPIHILMVALYLLAGVMFVTDFLIGKSGQATMKGHLFGLYYSIAGPWNSVFQRPAMIVDKLLSAVFGVNIWKPITLLRYAAFSVLFSVGLGFFILALQVGVSTATHILTHPWFAPVFIGIFALNTVGDVCVASVGRGVLRRIMKASTGSAFLWVIGLAALTCLITESLVIITVPTASTLYMAQFQVWQASDVDFWWNLLKLTIPGELGHPWTSDVSIALYRSPVLFLNPTDQPLPSTFKAAVNLVYLSIPALIPTCLLLILSFITIGIALLRPLLRSPLELILARIEAHHLGILTLLGGPLVFIATLIKWTT
jgi:hypothetical protein